VDDQNSKYAVEESIKKLDEFRKKYEALDSDKERLELSSDWAWFWFCAGSLIFAVYMAVMWLLH
jgi:hypothetical protein